PPWVPQGKPRSLESSWARARTGRRCSTPPRGWNSWALPTRCGWCRRIARRTSCSSTRPGPHRAACARSSPAPAAPPTCRACLRPRPAFPCSAYPCRARRSTAWIRCCRSCRCRRGFRWRPSPSAMRVRPTRRCSRPRCWPRAMPPSPRPWPPSANARPPTWSPRTIRASDLPPVTTVGILGGGQLARMLALSGAPLGLRFLVMDSAEDACAAQFAPMVLGDYRDQGALQEFASRIDVATFDFENVPAEAARWLAGRVPVFPNPGALATAQDRLAEKTLFREHGIPVPEFAPIASRAELDAAVERIGVP